MPVGPLLDEVAPRHRLSTLLQELFGTKQNEIVRAQVTVATTHVLAAHHTLSRHCPDRVRRDECQTDKKRIRSLYHIGECEECARHVVTKMAGQAVGTTTSDATSYRERPTGQCVDVSVGVSKPNFVVGCVCPQCYTFALPFLGRVR